jgi:hypothetical protein
LARVTGTRPGTWISLAKLGLLEDKDEPGHVWAGDQTCPARLSRIQTETRICLVFSGIFGLEIDFDDLHFTSSPNASPLIDGASRTQIK